MKEEKKQTKASESKDAGASARKSPPEASAAENSTSVSETFISFSPPPDRYIQSTSIFNHPSFFTLFSFLLEKKKRQAPKTSGTGKKVPADEPEEPPQQPKKKKSKVSDKSAAGGGDAKVSEDQPAKKKKKKKEKKKSQAAEEKEKKKSQAAVEDDDSSGGSGSGSIESEEIVAGTVPSPPKKKAPNESRGKHLTNKLPGSTPQPRIGKNAKGGKTLSRPLPPGLNSSSKEGKSDSESPSQASTESPPVERTHAKKSQEVIGSYKIGGKQISAQKYSEEATKQNARDQQGNHAHPPDETTKGEHGTCSFLLIICVLLMRIVNFSYTAGADGGDASTASSDSTSHEDGDKKPAANTKPPDGQINNCDSTSMLQGSVKTFMDLSVLQDEIMGGATEGASVPPFQGFINNADGINNIGENIPPKGASVHPSQGFIDNADGINDIEENIPAGIVDEMGEAIEGAYHHQQRSRVPSTVEFITAPARTAYERTILFAQHVPNPDQIEVDGKGSVIIRGPKDPAFVQKLLQASVAEGNKVKSETMNVYEDAVLTTQSGDDEEKPRDDEEEKGQLIV